jgi:hypothetical protein
VRPTWGDHWFYRILAEAAALAFATFVAAGFAHQRERVTAVVGGLTISAVYLIRLSILVFASQVLDADSYHLNEPPIQYIVDGIAMVAAPLIGMGVSEWAVQMHRKEPIGFGGINRWHFVWLWFAAGSYATAMLGPLLALWWGLQSVSIGVSFLYTLKFGVPVFALLAPVAIGLFILAEAGKSGSRKSAVILNLAGVIVLVVGFVIGVAIQYYWAKLMHMIFG